MPFNNIPFSGRSDFEDAEFTTSESEDPLTCTFFPKNSAAEALRKIEIANSLMVTLEQTILLGPPSVVLFNPANVEPAVREMADLRCDLMESLASIFCGELVNGRCLATGEPQSGVRFANCDSLMLTPSRPSQNPTPKGSRRLIISWEAEPIDGNPVIQLGDSPLFVHTTTIIQGDASVEVSIDAELIGLPQFIPDEFTDDIPYSIRSTLVSNPPHVQQFWRGSINPFDQQGDSRSNIGFGVARSPDYSGRAFVTIESSNFQPTRRAFAVEWFYN